jgi:Protein of unknown function (DUF5672)
MAPRLRLKDVTVCAADSLHPQLAARALEICLDKVDFADAVLFSDVNLPGRFRHEAIPPLRSSDDYSRFCLQELAKRIASKFVLVVQWDGYVVDPKAWTNEFLRYDYIGAPGFSSAKGGEKVWVVGNGGFSLRSRRLLDAVSKLPAIMGIAEDRLICEVFRDTIVREDGVRFAPEALADRFCFFQRDPRGATFGFHGFYNLHRVEDDQSVLTVVNALTPRQQISSDIFTLIHLAMQDGRTELARRLYGIVRQYKTAEEVRAVLTWQSGRPHVAAEFLDRLQTLFEDGPATPV